MKSLKGELLESVTPIQQILDFLPKKTPWHISGDSDSPFSLVVFRKDLWTTISIIECQLGHKLHWEIAQGIAETTIKINEKQEFTLSVVYEEEENE